MPKKTTNDKKSDIYEDFCDQRGLNYRKVIFVEHYIRNGGNGRQAAIEAGYAEKSADAQASVMLVNPKVRKLMKERMEQKIDSIHLTYESKLQSLHEMFKLAMSGKNTKSGKADLQAAKSIISEMNKMQGHYAADKRWTTVVNADIDKTEDVEELIHMYSKPI